MDSTTTIIHDSHFPVKKRTFDEFPVVSCHHKLPTVSESLEWYGGEQICPVHFGESFSKMSFATKTTQADRFREADDRFKSCKTETLQAVEAEDLEALVLRGLLGWTSCFLGKSGFLFSDQLAHAEPVSVFLGKGRKGMDLFM